VIPALHCRRLPLPTSCRLIPALLPIYPITNSTYNSSENWGRHYAGPLLGGRLHIVRMAFAIKAVF
jgi:hypothetical protein